MSSSSQLGKSESSSMSNHQRLYDFAKMALIKIFAHPYATVCELYCGEASDAHKWLDSQIANYIGIGMYVFILLHFLSPTSLIIIASFPQMFLLLRFNKFDNPWGTTTTNLALPISFTLTLPLLVFFLPFFCYF